MLADEEIIKDVIDREQGFVDHPDDKGGPTKYGITLSTLTAWRGKEVTKQDVEDLSKGEASDIYREMYISRPGLNRIPEWKLRGMLVDIAVNHGPKRAIKMLQKVLKIEEDGIIGPETIKAFFSITNHLKVYLGVCAERVRVYGRIITNDSKQASFAAGWAERAASFIDAAV